MKNIICHTNDNDFSTQKPTLLKKQPNVICLKLNFEQKTQKTQKTQEPGFFGFFEKTMFFSNPGLNNEPMKAYRRFMLYALNSLGFGLNPFSSTMEILKVKSRYSISTLQLNS
jgi:hypothetical protein